MLSLGRLGIILTGHNNLVVIHGHLGHWRDFQAEFAFGAFDLHRLVGNLNLDLVRDFDGYFSYSRHVINR